MPNMFRLEFDFPADESSLPIQEVVETYMHVLGMTSVKETYLNGMLPLWLYGYQKGDPRMQEAALGPLRTEGVSFIWPWFSEWRESFREAKLLPLSWLPFSDHVWDLRLGLRQERVAILSDVIWRTAWNRRLANQHAAFDDASRPRRSMAYTYDLRSDCEASQMVAARRLAGLVPGDWRTYPPYFPGDHSTVERVRA